MMISPKGLNIGKRDNVIIMIEDIWEAMIHTIKEGNFYCLSNVLVRIWSRKKKLSTPFCTTVSSITDETATVNIDVLLAASSTYFVQCDLFIVVPLNRHHMSP